MCFCSLSFYDLSDLWCTDDKKHTREENVVFRENFIFFHTLVAEELKNKKQKKKRQTKLVSFFCLRETKKRRTEFFSKQLPFFSSSSSSHIISITLSFVVSLCHVQKTTNRESFCE